MAYTIPNSCSKCGICVPECPTGAIQLEEGEYWIEPGLCDRCEELDKPKCIISCPLNLPVPLPQKKGRYKAESHLATSPSLFPNGQNNALASAMVVWEACNLLTKGIILPWQSDSQDKLYFERPVKQGKGAIAFWLTEDFETPSPSTLNTKAGFTSLEAFDIRAACLHLIYAAYTTTLERPWEQVFTLSDKQIEAYLGLDKRKDLSKSTKLTLIKTLVQQPCKIITAIDWPQQGKVKGFTLPPSRLWHLVATKHHFQEDAQGYKHLVGITFSIRPGEWAKYFLNKHAYKEQTAFYQYGSLPKFLLKTVMSIWQQHEGAVRLMLWLLFKTKIGQQQRITIPTLMKVAYGREKVNQASTQKEIRKKLIRTFESDLEVLNHYGIKAVFDPVTYPIEIQPLWAKLAELPDDAEEALEFWLNDGRSDRRLTDAAPSGKWNLLMKARILKFELPPGWSQPLTKLTTQKKRKLASNSSAKTQHKLNAEQIQLARKKQGYSQRKLADLIGKSQSWIRDLENGRLSAKLEDEELLRKVLNLKI
jgi:DNA-binding transcriptional regulator YiaG